MLFLGMLSILVYAFLSIRYPLLAGLARPNLVWSSMVGKTPMALLLHAIGYLTLTILYLIALRMFHIWQDQRSASTKHIPALVVVIWLLASVVLLFAAPAGESHDVFDYTYRGRMMAEYGLSPLALSPDRLPNQLFYNYLSWAGFVDTYGPVWEYASATVAVSIGKLLQLFSIQPPHSPGCVGTRPLCIPLAFYITGYRLLAILLTGVSGILIYKIAYPQSAQAAAIALLAWLWNPVVLIVTALGAHNDAILMPFLLASLLCFQHRRWLFGLGMLVLAAHVKLTALLMLPVLLIWLIWRTGWVGTLWRVTLTSLMALPLSWLLYVPLGGWETLPRMLDERARFLANSWPRVAYVALTDIYRWPERDAWRLTTNAATIGFLIAAALILIWRLQLFGLLRPRSNQQPFDETRLWQTAAEIMLCYLLIGSFWFQHWYLIWVLAPAVLRPQSWLVQTFLPWMGFAALASNIVSDFWYQPQPGTFTRTLNGATVAATIWLPMLVVVLWFAWHSWYRKQRQVASTARSK